MSNFATVIKRDVNGDLKHNHLRLPPQRRQRRQQCHTKSPMDNARDAATKIILKSLLSTTKDELLRKNNDKNASIAACSIIRQCLGNLYTNDLAKSIFDDSVLWAKIHYYRKKTKGIKKLTTQLRKQRLGKLIVKRESQK